MLVFIATGAWAGNRTQGTQAKKNRQNADLTQGVQLYKQGNYAQATTALKKAVDQDPKNEQALTYYGLTLVQSGKAAEAERSRPCSLQRH